jgi:hypothetical protein
MRVAVAVAVAAIALAACSGNGTGEAAPAPPAAPAEAPAPAAPSPAPGIRLLDFERDAEGAPPAGFAFALTGRGSPGRWVVVAGGAPAGGARCLRQADLDPEDLRFPVAVLEGTELRDVRVSVKCRMKGGRVDRGAGLVFRYGDAGNYYVTRANVLEGNVRLYTVKDGVRKQIYGWDGPIDGEAWHDYRVEARGDLLEVHWDGTKLFEVRDGTFPGPGRVGLWTKADSDSLFDDLAVEGL